VVLLVMAHCVVLALLAVLEHYHNRPWFLADAAVAFASGQITLLLLWLVIGRSGVGVRLAACACAAFVMIAALSFPYVEANQPVLRWLSDPRGTWGSYVWLGYFYGSAGGRLTLSLPFQAASVILVLTAARALGLLGRRPNRFQLTLTDLFALSFAVAVVLGTGLSVQPYEGWYFEFARVYWWQLVHEPAFPVYWYWHAWEGIISAAAAATGYRAFLSVHASRRKALGFGAVLATLYVVKHTVLVCVISWGVPDTALLSEMLCAGIASSVASILCVGGTLLLVGWWRRRGPGVPESRDGGEETPSPGVA
jgi:hypothetical protein